MRMTMSRSARISQVGLLVLLLFSIAPKAVQVKTTGPPQVDQVAGHDVLKAFSSQELGRNLIFVSTPDAIFQDSKGIFWFGGPRGLCSYDEKEDRWVDYSRAARSDAVMTDDEWKPGWICSVCADKQGRIWVQGVISKFAFWEGGQWRNANELLPPNITSLGRTLIAGRDGRIWFVSPQGLVAYEGRSWTGPSNPPDTAMRIYNQFKFTYADKGLARLGDIQDRMHKDLGEKLPQPLWTSEVRSGIQDHDGDIWLGAARGIWRFDEKTGDWKVYPMHGLVEEVSLIYTDRYGRIWFADDAAHLALYDKYKDTWTSYDLAFEDAVVDAVYVDKQGKVIIGAPLGIIILNEWTGKTQPSPVRIGGKLGRGITAMKEDNQGRIWIGSYDGIFILKQ
jgi:ligand-binding sensor domain-containing protein